MKTELIEELRLELVQLLSNDNISETEKMLLLTEILEELQVND